MQRLARELQHAANAPGYEQHYARVHQQENQGCHVYPQPFQISDF
jgi:hypothetical protein